MLHQRHWFGQTVSFRAERTQIYFSLVQHWAYYKLMWCLLNLLAQASQLLKVLFVAGFKFLLFYSLPVWMSFWHLHTYRLHVNCPDPSRAWVNWCSWEFSYMCSLLRLSLQGFFRCRVSYMCSEMLLIHILATRFLHKLRILQTHTAAKLTY